MNGSDQCRPSPLMGGSSLLVVFSVLCLTVFALLSLSTVQANTRLRLAVEENVENYYRADAQAQTMLAQLRQGIVPSGVEVWKTGNRYAYTCPISDTQEIYVLVRVDSAADYTVHRWQVRASKQWEAKEHIQVWDGHSIP